MSYHFVNILIPMNTLRCTLNEKQFTSTFIPHIKNYIVCKQEMKHVPRLGSLTYLSRKYGKNFKPLLPRWEVTE